MNIEQLSNGVPPGPAVETSKVAIVFAVPPSVVVFVPVITSRIFSVAI
jgi:hypothetical protein